MPVEGSFAHAHSMKDKRSNSNYFRALFILNVTGNGINICISCVVQGCSHKWLPCSLQQALPHCFRLRMWAGTDTHHENTHQVASTVSLCSEEIQIAASTILYIQRQRLNIRFTRKKLLPTLTAVMTPSIQRMTMDLDFKNRGDQHQALRPELRRKIEMAKV